MHKIFNVSLLNHSAMVTISFMDLITITSYAKVICRRHNESRLIKKLDEIRDWASKQSYEEIDDEEIVIETLPF